MELADLEVLGYLHDAVVESLVYRLGADDNREFVLTAICDPSAGYPEWEGKRIVVRWHDLVLANHFVVGAVTGPELIDSCTPRLSPSMTAELQRLLSAGMGVPGLSFSVSFHSGSFLEGTCRHVFVEVGELV